MKAVLISLRPGWCEEVAILRKTDELRKNAPKLPTPFKVYIYQTKCRWMYKLLEPLSSLRWARAIMEGQQRVIGEFFCTKITPVTKDNREALSETTCVPLQDMYYYAGTKSIYDLKAWHISQLKIYNKPLRLSEFRKSCVNELYCDSCGMHSEHNNSCGNAALQLTRPPQSWCYVEELK